MPCYHPIKAFQAIIDQESKERVKGQKLIFNEAKLDSDLLYRPLEIGCGQCIGCRLDRSRVWALRCCHEASLHEQNIFVTLTVDPNLYPDLHNRLDHTVFSAFLKRLRFYASSKLGIDSGIRFFNCGEYGAPIIDPDTGVIQRFRHAHYHAIIFGFDFPDKELWTIKHGSSLYRSPTLEKIWPYGFSTIGNVTFESCAYVARYVTKKVTGKLADEWYGDQPREYVQCSRRPGVAREWIEKFHSDVYPKDFITFNNGLKLRPPRYYDKVFDLINHNEMKNIKEEREERMEEVIITPEYVKEHTPERLSTKEKLKLMQFSKLVRSLEI